MLESGTVVSGVRGRHQCLLEGSPKEAAGIWLGGRGSSGDDPESDSEGPRLLQTQTPGLRTWEGQTSVPTGLPQTQGHTAHGILGPKGHVACRSPGPAAVRTPTQQALAKPCQELGWP